jgi:hypothetical protein
MNTRNIQTFLMVSTAFFAMSVPVRSGSAGALANAAAHSAQVTAARLAPARVASASKTEEDERRS